MLRIPFIHIIPPSSDDIPATGTGTLLIQLEDVNDNAPVIMERSISVCNKDSVPHVLSVTDKDGPTFAAPYKVVLEGGNPKNWTASMNDTRTYHEITRTLHK